MISYHFSIRCFLIWISREKKSLQKSKEIIKLRFLNSTRSKRLFGSLSSNCNKSWFFSYDLLYWQWEAEKINRNTQDLRRHEKKNRGNLSLFIILSFFADRMLYQISYQNLTHTVFIQPYCCSTFKSFTQKFESMNYTVNWLITRETQRNLYTLNWNQSGDPQTPAISAADSGIYRENQGNYCEALWFVYSLSLFLNKKWILYWTITFMSFKLINSQGNHRWNIGEIPDSKNLRIISNICVIKIIVLLKFMAVWRVCGSH